MHTKHHARLCIGRGKFFSLTDPSKHTHLEAYGSMAWPDILRYAATPEALHPTTTPKEAGWWIIASDVLHRRARLGHVQREEGRFWILIADIDQGNLPLATVGAGLQRALDPGTEYLIYATRSSKPDHRRWKIMVPLGTPCPGAIYHHFAEQFNLYLAWALGVAADACTDREHQITFLPNRGEHYEWYHHPGAAFGQAADDTLAHALVNCARQAEAQAAPRRSGNATRQKERGYYLEQFCKTFTVEQLLIRYGFEQHPSNPQKWHHPNQTTNGYGTEIVDDGMAWVAAGQTVPTMIGRSGGDAFDLYVAFECNHDRVQAYANIVAYFKSGGNEPPRIECGEYITCNGQKIKLGVVQ